mgnify:CR=1 FL=1
MEEISHKLSAYSSNSKIYADIHIHPTLKPYNWFETDSNNNKSSIYYQKKPKRRQKDNQVVNFTQSDLKTIAESNTKLVYASFSPIERNWFNHSEINKRIASILFGLELSRINNLSKQTNYFVEFENEINLFRKEQNKIFSVNGINYKIAVPKTYQELNNNFSQNIINVIPTIEGIHSLFSYEPEKIITQQRSLFENINFIKKNEFKPFFITLSHHFYNFLSGHCKSIFTENTLLDKFLKMIVDQNQGMNATLTTFGKEIIKYLLEIEHYSNKNQRVLIDIKHLSVESRKMYYEMLCTHNNNNPSNKIPIIASHCAYSGVNSYEQLGKTDEVHFNNNTVNLCAQDVKQIYLSSGLIGITIDERVLASSHFRKIIKKLENDYESYTKIWASHICYHICKMAEVIINDPSIEDKSFVWNLFAIGSDFDGFINPVNSFASALQFRDLEMYLIYAFEENRFFKLFMDKISAYEVVRKIMFENAYNFTSKHYFIKNENTSQEQLQIGSSSWTI